jgi:hypothetical protein
MQDVIAFLGAVVVVGFVFGYVAVMPARRRWRRRHAARRPGYIDLRSRH